MNPEERIQKLEDKVKNLETWVQQLKIEKKSCVFKKEEIERMRREILK